MELTGTPKQNGFYFPAEFAPQSQSHRRGYRGLS